MLPESLLALACLIANKGPLDTSTIEAQLSDTEATRIQSIIQSDACLPENMEQLIKETHDKITSGELTEIAEGSEPTRGCG
jgi:hypothetical protein